MTEDAMRKKNLKGGVIPKVKLLFNNMLVTTTKEKTVSGKILIVNAKSKAKILSKQTVVASGPNAVAQPGDKLELNVDLFRKERINAKNDVGPDSYVIIPPLEEIDGVMYLLISDREVKYIYK